MVSSEDVFEVWKGKTSYLPRDVSFGGVLGTNGGVRYAVKVGGRSTPLTAVPRGTSTRHTGTACPPGLLRQEWVYAGRSSDVVPESWIIFNDFLVRAIPEEEVFSFPDQWKVSILVRDCAYSLDSRSDHP